MLWFDALVQLNIEKTNRSGHLSRLKSLTFRIGGPVMKKCLPIVVLLLTGCAADPEKLNSVAVEEAARLPKPTKAFATFADYELKPFVLSPAVTEDADKVVEAKILEEHISEKLLPLFDMWSRADPAERSGKLIVQPELVSIRIVSGGARFWVGAFAGDSNIDLDLKISEEEGGEVIAAPRIQRDADAMAGGWSIGKSDDNLHDYIAFITREYFETNY